MRKIVRTGSPSCLLQNATTWTADYVAQTPPRKFLWRSTNCYQNIRAALLAMTQYHCAFCDGPLGSESRETVEHFQPKETFPEQAYEWMNLFPCCDRCQSKKGKQYNSNLLKPDYQNYQFDNYFMVNFKTGAIEPNLQASSLDQEKAKTTIELYGLNIEQRQKARFKELKAFNQDAQPNIDDYNYRYFLEAAC